MVPSEEWCDGAHTPEEKAAARADGSGTGGFWSRLLGR
jgi:hypothetical protein